MNLVSADAAAVRLSVRLVAGVTVDQWGWGTPCAGWDLADLLTHMTDQHRIFTAAALGKTPGPSTDLMPNLSLADASRPGAGNSRSVAGASPSIERAFPSSAGPPPAASAPFASPRGFSGADQALSAAGEMFGLASVGDGPGLVDAYVGAAAMVLAAFDEPGVSDREFLLADISADRTFPGRQAIGFHLVDYVVHGWDVARALGVPYQPDPEVLAFAVAIARAVPTGPSRLVPGAAFAPALTVPSAADALTETLLLLGRDPAWRR